MRTLVSDHPRRIALIASLALAPLTPSAARAADTITIDIGIPAADVQPVEQLSMNWAEVELDQSGAYFDGRFLRADDLKSEPYRVRVSGDYADGVEYRLYSEIDGADFTIWQRGFGASPFTLEGYFVGHEATVEADPHEGQIEIASWSFGPATATLPDGRRIEIEALEVRVPIPEARGHELGHALGFRHEHTRPTAYEMTFTLTAPE